MGWSLRLVDAARVSPSRSHSYARARRSPVRTCARSRTRAYSPAGVVPGASRWISVGFGPALQTRKPWKPFGSPGLRVRGRVASNWGRVLLGPYNALGTARPALVRPRIVRVCGDAPGESFAGPRLPRRDGGRPRLLPRAVAQSARLAAALRLARHARGARLLGALPAAHAAHAALGGRAAGARAGDPAAARHPHRRHADRLAGLRRRGRLFPRGAVAVGARAGPRQPAGADRGPGVGARDDRPALDRQAAR